MWKNYLDIIKERDGDYSHQEYCLWFVGHFSYNILNLSDFTEILEQENGDLLPISKNLTDFFYSNSVEFIVNLIYHINELENLEFIIMDKAFDSNIDALFASRDDKQYFFNLFSFDNEVLLSSDANEATLLYLFLFFLPQNKSQDLLYHSKKKIPLISCNQITFTHFEMLAYIMKTFHKESYDSLCSDYNLNFILLEDFCKSAIEIYTFLDKDDWYDRLPLEKIKFLFKDGCDLKDFLNYKQRSAYQGAPTLIDFIVYFRKELEFITLKEKVTSGQILTRSDRVVKI